MIFNIIPLLLLFALLCFCSCRKEYSYEGGPKKAIDPTISDTTITDATLFIDVTIDGKRYFAIDSRVENEWHWLPVDIRYYDLRLNTYCFLSSFTTGLGKTIHYDSWYSDGLPQFYFSKTESGVDIASNNTNSTNVFTFTSGFLDNFFKIGQCNYSVPVNRDTTFTPYRLYGIPLPIPVSCQVQAFRLHGSIVQEKSGKQVMEPWPKPEATL